MRIIIENKLIEEMTLDEQDEIWQLSRNNEVYQLDCNGELWQILDCTEEID